MDVFSETKKKRFSIPHELLAYFAFILSGESLNSSNPIVYGELCFVQF